MDGWIHDPMLAIEREKRMNYSRVFDFGWVFGDNSSLHLGITKLSENNYHYL